MVLAPATDIDIATANYVCSATLALPLLDLIRPHILKAPDARKATTVKRQAFVWRHVFITHSES